MKKAILTGFLTSMLIMSGAAFAQGENEVESGTNDSATLTTKNYVDSGLRYIYGIKADKADVYTKDQVYTKTEADNRFLTQHQDISGKADADSVYTKTEADNKFLTQHQDISGKADASTVYTKTEADDRFLGKDALNGLDGTAYQGENGVSVSNHKVGLDVTPTAGNMYVYTSTGWQPLPVQDTWSADIFTTP